MKLTLRLTYLGILYFSLTSLNAQDWLIDPSSYSASIESDEQSITISNGLVKRGFFKGENLVCHSYLNLSNNDQWIRSLRPEARVTINGVAYNIGGVYGQQEHGYFQDHLLESLESNPNDFQFVNHTIKDFAPSWKWTPKTWLSNPNQPRGKELILQFVSNNELLSGIKISVHYLIYDGIPVITKWVEIENNGPKSIQIDQVVSEVLATPEEESAVVGKVYQMEHPQRIFIENNFAFNNAMNYEISDQATHWKTDSAYTSQVNYNYQTPCVLEIYPAKGIGVDLKPKETFTSIKSNELLLDSYDRERQGLARRKMYRTIAPWTTQNPIFMHLISTEDEVVKEVIDQCAETGYEMLILSFGSGLTMEDTSAANISKFKKLADYAHSKGILLGGYSLFSSRSIGPETDVIDPVTGLPNKHAQFGQAPCLASKWGVGYLKSIKKFIDDTGFDLLEHDGPYPGDVCASTTHIGHEGLHDSQWRQMELQKELYRYLNSKGVYINAPDWYFMDGSHKIALGYREVNFSLSREQQRILNRQNIYDGTWEKIPSMGWGFVPLTKYQGGGPEAILEPLKDHLEDYKQLMVQYYGAGVQACYRGPRLYDAPETKELVIETIKWYKKNRDIFNSDIIHLRRPDGRDWDGIMHVNPELETKAFALLYNPTSKVIKRQISLPLYYSGLTKEADLKIGSEDFKKFTIQRDYAVSVEIEIPANSYQTVEVRSVHGE